MTGRSAWTQGEPIRVALVVSRLQRGGLEQVLLDVAQGLTPRGFRFEVVALHGAGERDGEFEAAGIAVTHLAGRPRIASVAANLLCWAKLLRVLHRIRPHVVQTHHFFSGTLGRIAARAAGVPVVVQADHNFYAWKGAAARAVDRVLARTTDAFVVPSSALAAHVASFHGVDGSRVHVVPNGIAPHPALLPARDARLALGLPPAAPIVGFVGRLAPIKRPLEFIRMFASIAGAHDSAVAAVLGDGPLATSVRGAARQLGERVRFCGDVPDAAAFMRAFDVLVTTSSEEGFGLAPCEAVLAGVPVVVPPLPPLVELLRGLPGHHFTDDPAPVVLAILRDPSAAHLATHQLRERLLRELAPEAMIAGYESLYRRLVSRALGPDPAVARA
ncbi:MAG: glycosyltransferase [Candidatus Wallbacteria bacterium]|nr:glycosyltransferase [Candidatus Wallbacteria bacterium]